MVRGLRQAAVDEGDCSRLTAEEIIEHGRTGVIVRAGDPGSLTEAVATLFTDVPLRTRLGSAAAAAVARRFSPSAFAARFYALLDLPPARAPC